MATVFLITSSSSTRSTVTGADEPPPTSETDIDSPDVVVVDPMIENDRKDMPDPHAGHQPLIQGRYMIKPSLKQCRGRPDISGAHSEAHEKPKTTTQSRVCV